MITKDTPILRTSILDPQFSPTAITLWAGGQLAAILFAAADLPLWAHHPLPRSSLALNELMAVQIFATAMLCPILAAAWLTILINALLTLSFCELAGLLSSQPHSAVVQSWLLITIWQIGISGWVRQFKGQGRIYVASISLLLSLGGVLLFYLRNEQIAVDGGIVGDFRGSGSSENFRSTTQIDWILGLAPILSYLFWIAGRYLNIARKRSSTSLHWH